MSKALLICCLVSLSIVLGVGISAATQIEYVSPQQMGDEAALVVRGEVSGVRSFWNATHTKILTETTVSVDETYKGAGVSAARILQLGGVADKIRMHVHGALSWRTGEEVVVFLDRLDSGAYRVTGFSQGKFNIERDPATGDAFITRPMLEDTDVLTAPARDGRGPDMVPARMPLDEFINQALGRK